MTAPLVPWPGIQRFTRPITSDPMNGPWMDVYHRKSQNDWVLWAPVRRPNGNTYDIAIFGAFKEVHFARYVADSAIARMRPNWLGVPSVLDLSLCQTSEDLWNTVMELADETPSPSQDQKIMRHLSREEREELTARAETFSTIIQHWRLFLVPAKGGAGMIPSFVRLRGTASVAAGIPYSPAAYAGEHVTYMLDSIERTHPTTGADRLNGSENSLDTNLQRVTRNLADSCDAELATKYGAEAGTLNDFFNYIADVNDQLTTQATESGDMLGLLGPKSVGQA